MALKVYAPPSELEQPEIGQGSLDDYFAAEAKYIEDLRAWCKKQKPKGQLVGEIVQFPVADGYAQYMIAQLSPCKLIHIPTGDAWQYAHIERLTTKDIRANVESRKSLEALCARRKNNDKANA